MRKIIISHIISTLILFFLIALHRLSHYIVCNSKLYNWYNNFLTSCLIHFLIHIIIIILLIINKVSVLQDIINDLEYTRNALKFYFLLILSSNYFQNSSGELCGGF